MVFDQASNSWAGQSYEEIVQTADRDGSVVVVPVGSVEQHGHHMPVATDTILVNAVATLGAQRASDDPVLVTPPVWTGNSPHHMPFGGTISVGVHGLLDLLERVADTVLDSGFDALVFLNGHGGNAATIDDATSTVGDTHPTTEVLALTYFELAKGFINEVRESDLVGIAHAGEFETSLMLHLEPDLVDTEALEGTPLDEPYDRANEDLLERGPLSVYRTFDEYSAGGAIGNPPSRYRRKG